MAKFITVPLGGSYTYGNEVALNIDHIVLIRRQKPGDRTNFSSIIESLGNKQEVYTFLSLDDINKLEIWSIGQDVC